MKYTKDELKTMADNRDTVRYVVDRTGVILDVPMTFTYDEAIEKFDRIGFTVHSRAHPVGSHVFGASVDVPLKDFVDPNQMLNFLENAVIQNVLEHIYQIEYIQRANQYISTS